MIDLYYWGTPNGLKPRLMLEETGLDYRIVPVDIGKGEQFRPEFLAFAPNNRIPALIDHAPADGGEPVKLFESGAILQYLAEKSGRFLPADPRGRADVMQWLFWQVGGLGPMAGQAAHFHYQKEKIEYAITRYTNESKRLYGVLDRHLKDSEYLGDDYSIADMATWPWVRGYKALGIDLAELPNLQRWFKLVGAREAVKTGSSIGKDDFARRQKEMRGEPKA